jgi:hypothetical protein
MALIEFKDLPDTSTAINSLNLNNNFNELDTKVNNLSILETHTIDVNITSGTSYQNDLLKNAKLVICDWGVNLDSWTMQTMHIKSGYSLNTYNGYDVGSMYNSTTGTITHQYDSSGGLSILKLFILR